MSFKSMRTVGIACLLLAILLPLAATMSLSPTSSGQAKCSDFVSCGSCATQPGCGWCAYLFTCLPGTVNGSTSGSCTEEWTVWMYQPSECPAQSPFPSLCTSKPCSDCVAADYCGWCGSTCVPGTASSPYYGTCSGWYFDHCPVVLARNVWWLWALFAFLLLSMLLTALGTCFFKRCRAIINGTPVSGEHTPPVYQTKLYMSADSQNASDAEHALIEEDN